MQGLTPCRRLGMKKINLLILAIIISNFILIRVTYSFEFPLNLELPAGAYRICNSKESVTNLRNKTTNLIQTSTNFDDHISTGCLIKLTKLTLLEEIESIPRGKSVNVMYTPSGIKVCELLINNVDTNVPCNHIVEETKYYRAIANLGGQKYNVFVEVFPSPNIYQQYAEAQKK